MGLFIPLSFTCRVDKGFEVEQNIHERTHLFWIGHRDNTQTGTHFTHLPHGTSAGAARSGEGGLDEGSGRADAGEEGEDTHG